MNFRYRIILQHFERIANYVNYVFKNIATYDNLILIYVYLSKITNNN